MQRRQHRVQSGAMHVRRTAALAALVLVPALAGASDLDSAMHCVRATVASPLLPATAHPEQLANVALSRCGDEIERAAIAMAGTPLVHARVEVSRTAIRQELHGYAIAVASGSATGGQAEPAAATPSTAW
jgi:hypothetical protein